VRTTIGLNGTRKYAATGTAWVLTGADPQNENSFAQPQKVIPKEEAVPGIAREFQRVFPAYSITVLRIPGK
jgi:alpha-L-arabinofuranosidase